MTFHRETPLPSIHTLRLLACLCLAGLLGLAAVPARAVSLIRDPDIENALAHVAAPILNAAGLGRNVKVLVVNDRSLNAFVVDNNHIYIHLGMLVRMQTPEMLQAVIAHEAAHITNGHVARRVAHLGNARSAANLGMALAIAAAAVTGKADAAAGLAAGTQSSALRRFLAHTRAEETAADQSGARYMVRAGVDPQGAVDVHKIFQGQELLNTSRQDPYVRSHPLTRDRIRAMQAIVAGYSGPTKPQPDMIYWFARARAKAAAFSRSPKWTLQQAAKSTAPDIRLMQEAIAYHRRSDTSTALSRMDKAIALRPKDAFYRELKGQILLESRRFSAAIPVYHRAVDLAPRNALCLASLGHALLAANRPKEALTYLRKSRDIDFRNTRLLRDLGAAYAQTGQNGLASLATAERYALQGRLKDAEIHAKRASGLLSRGSRAWRRAEDILSDAKRAKK